MSEEKKDVPAKSGVEKIKDATKEVATATPKPPAEKPEETVDEALEKIIKEDAEEKAKSVITKANDSTKEAKQKSSIEKSEKPKKEPKPKMNEDEKKTEKGLKTFVAEFKKGTKDFIKVLCFDTEKGFVYVVAGSKKDGSFRCIKIRPNGPNSNVYSASGVDFEGFCTKATELV